VHTFTYLMLYALHEVDAGRSALAEKEYEHAAGETSLPS
jgi:hypothetical protein